MRSPSMNIGLVSSQTFGTDPLQNRPTWGWSQERCLDLKLIEESLWKNSKDNTRTAKIWLTWRKCGSLDVIVVCLGVRKSWSSKSHSLHKDVGGGAVKNDVRNSLARIPLRWMVRQCFILETGILFHREPLKTIGMDPSSLWPVVKSRPPPLSPFSMAKSPVSTVGTDNTLADLKRLVNEEEEELRDALSPINDMLKISPMWWILEVIPQKQRFQKDDDSWTRRLS